MCENKRTFGIELEGYTNSRIVGDYVKGWELVDDGSLNEGERECQDCDGEGTVICNDCDGDGWVDCSECEGSGIQHCCECNGEGTIMRECGECEGSGGEYDEDGVWVDCSLCDGDCEVEEDCDECGGDGEDDCGYCEGRGRENCDTCSSDGNIECNECYGSGNYGDGECGVECVSDVLRDGEFDSLDRIFDYINGYSWMVNDDCGTHVHVGTDDLEIVDIQKLAIIMHVVEPAIYGMNGLNRFNGTYCKPMNKAFLRSLLDREFTDKYDFGSKYYGYTINSNTYFDKYASMRYFGLNIHAYYYKGTIEFRYFNGCDDADVAREIVELCVKLTDFAKATSFEQTLYIAKQLAATDNFRELANKIEDMLSLSFNLRLYSPRAYNYAKERICEELKIPSNIEETA